jgi:hypothetical protein
MVEALPYYIDNPTYLMREGRFGNTVKFTTNALLSLSLDEILATARSLQAKEARPILILLSAQLDRDQPDQVKEGYNWLLLTTPEQVGRFLDETNLRAQFRPRKGDEKYDVYLLKGTESPRAD